jgi:hypothetical protein
LKRFRDEDRAAEMLALYCDDDSVGTEDADLGMDEDEDMVETEDDLEDAAAAAWAENEDKVAAETVVLPIRSTSKPSDTNST